MDGNKTVTITDVFDHWKAQWQSNLATVRDCEQKCQNCILEQQRAYENAKSNLINNISTIFDIYVNSRLGLGEFRNNNSSNNDHLSSLLEVSSWKNSLESVKVNIDEYFPANVDTITKNTAISICVTTLTHAIKRLPNDINSVVDQRVQDFVAKENESMGKLTDGLMSSILDSLPTIGTTNANTVTVPKTNFNTCTADGNFANNSANGSITNVKVEEIQHPNEKANIAPLPNLLEHSSVLNQNVGSIVVPNIKAEKAQHGCTSNKVGNGLLLPQIPMQQNKSTSM